MGFPCFSCGKDLDFSDPQAVGRRATCPHCQADAHCCFNCSFYDSASYNECREPQAERVLDKDRSNFCDFFRLSATPTKRGAKSSPQVDARKKLDDLFKK